MLSRFISPARLNHFDRHLNDLAGGRTTTPTDPRLDPALTETARRLHALRDDSAPDPIVLVPIWEDLVGRPETMPRVESAPLSPVLRNGRLRSWVRHDTRPLFKPVRRGRPRFELATVAVLVLVLLSGYGAYQLVPPRPQSGGDYAAGRQGATSVATPDVPEPSECRVAPIPLERWMATHEPSVPSALVASRHEGDG